MMKKTKAKLHRCRTETSVACDDPEYGRRMGAGQFVDLSEKVGKNKKGAAVTLGELVRADCFEELEELEDFHQVEDEPAPAETEIKKPRGNQ